MNPRAWATLFASCVALGLVLSIVLRPNPGAPEAPQSCRALAAQPRAPLTCLDGLCPKILCAEMAANHSQWECLVQRGDPVSAMSVEQCEFAEMRTRGLRSEVTGFDNRFFIPLYTLLSALLVGWVWSRSSLSSEQSPRMVRSKAIALCVSTAVLVSLDLRENTQLMAILDLLDRIGVAGVIGKRSAADVAILDTTARTLRRASCYKWGAGAMWALALSAVFRAVLRWAPADEAPRPWRWLAATVWATALLAAAATGAGAAYGLLGDSLITPVRLLEAGMYLVMGAMVGAAFLAVWAAIERGGLYNGGESR